MGKDARDEVSGASAKGAIIDTYAICPNGKRRLYAVNNCFASTSEAEAFYGKTNSYLRFVAQVRGVA
jgi:hypothetical protein